MFNSQSSGFLNSGAAPPFWSNGPAPGQFQNFGISGYQQTSPVTTMPAGINGAQHSKAPITTGTSVLGIRFDRGVIIAADTLLSYGSLARFTDVPRVFKINDKTILGAGGDYADFQYIKRAIDQKIIEDQCHDDQIIIKPKSLYNWLTRVMYNRRCRFNPLWLELVVGGISEEGLPFLGHVDVRGRAYTDNVIGTGFARHLAVPLVREAQENGMKTLTAEEAGSVMRKCLEVLYYRDCRASNKFMVAVCTRDDCTVQGPFSVSENWNLAPLIKGY